MNLIGVVRARTWWNIIVPQVLGWIYFCLLTSAVNPQTDALRITYFFFALIFISTFGYLFNDYCDQHTDKISGKKNLLSGFHPLIKILLLVSSFSAGCIFWLGVKASTTANILFALQIGALVLYSLPPFRFKNWAIAGIVADAFYGHVNPVLITLFTFYILTNFTTQQTILVCVVVACTSLKGIRNIILHQIDDRKKDKQAGIRTMVVVKGAFSPLRFINSLLPLEVVMAVILTGLISFHFPPFLFTVLLFALFTFLKFSGWRLIYAPQRQLLFKFLYFLNDFYEGWLPVFLLLALSMKQPIYLSLLLVHLLMFPNFLIKLLEGFKTIRKNIDSDENY